MTGAGEVSAASADTRLARSTAAMTGLTAVSRVTGFVRVLVVAAVLGPTYLGNTYQSANTVPNLLFELLAAGALQAVLVPTLVDVLGRGGRGDAEHVAGSVLGLVCGGLAALAAAGMVAAPLIMRVLVAGVDDPTVRDEQVELGTFFLWFFLPQVVLYAAAMVATAVLNAQDRFAVPVFAPVVNNVVVVAAYLLFWRLRDGQEPSLDLTFAEKVVLAGGTTAAVVAFCSLPVIAVVRGGFSLRPRFDWRHPAVRRLARLGGWAALYLAMTQVLLLVALVLGNSVEGGVIAYQVGFTFFLLPHALFALPIITALFPELARQSQAGDTAAYARSVGRGLRVIAFFVLPATAAFLALAPLAARLVLFGESAGAGEGDVAGVVRGFALGLLGYGAFLFLTRAFYAVDDTRTPALVNVAVAAAGTVLMVVSAAVLDGDDRIAGLAVSHSLAYLAGAAALAVLLRGRLPSRALGGVVAPLGALAVAAVLAGLAMWALAEVLPGSGAGARLVALGAAGVVGGVLYLGVERLLGGPSPRRVVDLMRGGGSDR